MTNLFLILTSVSATGSGLVHLCSVFSTAMKNCLQLGDYIEPSTKGRSRATRRAECGEQCEPYRTIPPADEMYVPDNNLRAGLKGAGRSTCPDDASTAGTRRAASRGR